MDDLYKSNLYEPGQAEPLVDIAVFRTLVGDASDALIDPEERVSFMDILDRISDDE